MSDLKTLAECWACMDGDAIVSRHDDEASAEKACANGQVVAHVKPRGLRASVGFLRLKPARVKS